MSVHEHRRDILENRPRYKIPERDRRCEHARAFADWVDGWLFSKILTEEEDDEKAYARTQYALALLAKECVAFINGVPKSHSIPWTDRGHKCIPWVFMQAVKRIIEIEREIDPASIFEPSSPMQVVDMQGTLYAVEEYYHGKKTQAPG